MRRWVIGAAAAVVLAGCQRPLPEPESPGGKLYAERCGSCHRAFQPSSLKFEMWKVQVDRKQSVMARAGMAPLTDADRALVLDYLKRHSG